MLFATTQIVLVYHSSLALLIERHNLLFCITIAEHCVYDVRAFFLSALLGEPVEATEFMKVLQLLLSQVYFFLHGVLSTHSFLPLGSSPSFKAVRTTTGRHI